MERGFQVEMLALWAILSPRNDRFTDVHAGRALRSRSLKPHGDADTGYCVQLG